MEFSKEIILEASKTDLLSYCQSNGFEIVQKGSAYFLKEFDSCQISGNMWNRWSEKFAQAGLYNQGNAIQFVREFENLSFQDAVLKLLEFRGIEIQGEFEKKLAPGYQEIKKKENNIIKEKAKVQDNIKKYLNFLKKIITTNA